MMKRIIMITAALMAVLSLDAQNLTVLHFNDTHSHVDPQRSGEYKGLGGVVEQAAYVDSVRKADGRRNVLLLHAGDFGQGTSYFTELGGNIEIDVMNTMKFDVVALGNHEFDNGVVELARRLGNLKAEVVCANYDFTGTPVEEYVKPYAIVRRGGLKVGIIGLLTDITRVVDMNLVGNLEYQDPAEVVNRYAAYLKNEKGCDLVFCLSHLGFSGDMETAPKIRNVDVIVGGHSHTRLDAMEVVKDLDGKDVMIVQDWCWGMTVGNLKVSY